MDGIILVNKPTGITSHTLVQRARRKLGISRIGHTGTLDPLAEGLMLLTVGKATKILPYISHYFKEYVATMILGKRTDTLDVTGTVLEEKTVRNYSDEEIIEVLDSFLGEGEQLPPMYSAKRVNGQHLYDLARQNIEVSRDKQRIEIREIELLEHNGNKITFRAVVSTGTYIRVLIEDIAAKLDTIAAMESLKRTSIDHYRLEDACEVEELDENVKFIKPYEALENYFYQEIDDPADVLNGKRIRLEEGLPDTLMITHQGEVLACYEKKDGFYYCKRGLW